jgi:tRNA(fMet)-specific endonuclease VapC
MYILDTNHCIRILIKKLDIKQKLGSIGNADIGTCVVVAGELFYGAYKSHKVKDNLREIYELLNDMQVLYDVDNETAEVYGKLKAEIVERFGPKDNTKRRNTKPESLGFKDNDLWIASIAIQHNLVLVSADKHILELQGIVGLRVESW